MILYLIFNYYQMNIFIGIASLIVFVYFFFIMAFFFSHRRVIIWLDSLIIYRKHQLLFLLAWLLDWSCLWKLISLSILRRIMGIRFGISYSWFCCRLSCSRMDTIFRKGSLCKIYFMSICMGSLEPLSILCLFGDFLHWWIITV